MSCKFTQFSEGLGLFTSCVCLLLATPLLSPTSTVFQRNIKENLGKGNTVVHGKLPTEFNTFDGMGHPLGSI